MKVILLLVGACLFTTGALAQSVQEMQKMADDYQAAFNKGDTATVANFYKDDAVAFPPGGDMVKGKQAIQAFFTEAAKGIQIVNIKVIDVRSLGPNAAREQSYATVKTKGDNPQEMLGKSVVIWERVDGKWKVDSDIWNMNK